MDFHTGIGHINFLISLFFQIIFHFLFFFISRFPTQIWSSSTYTLVHVHCYPYLKEKSHDYNNNELWDTSDCTYLHVCLLYILSISDDSINWKIQLKYGVSIGRGLCMHCDWACACKFEAKKCWEIYVCSAVLYVCVRIYISYDNGWLSRIYSVDSRTLKEAIARVGAALRTTTMKKEWNLNLCTAHNVWNVHSFVHVSVCASEERNHTHLSQTDPRIYRV